MASRPVGVPFTFRRVTAGPSPASRTLRTMATVTLRTRFHNIPGRIPDRKAHPFLTRLLDDADLAVFAEANRWVPFLETVPGFTMYAGHKPVPILWRTSAFEWLGEGVRFATPDTPVGDRGAGPSTLREKDVPRVELRHKASGLTVTALGFHAAPTISIPVRDKLHEEQVRAVAREVDRSYTDLVLVCLDANAGFGHPNMLPLHDRTVDDSTGPTMRLGHPDHILRRGRVHGMRVDAFTRPGLLRLDHRVVGVDYTFPASRR